MKKEKFLKKTLTTKLIGTLTFLGGFYFLSKNITGNTILNEGKIFNLLSLIGLLLIVCSAILITYSIRKK